ncbi:hypothetical protein GCM10007390_13320 [Persicitalea jodogahamensis]|uniref:Uncharacterized protein n=1 Tax=Persicitalea jodogahamensis TaxID=402147 RepID=A0A8J3D519_9BACT|nr:hypothetical protein GCM10007390_13320 [Persicitalea jodogahamensis]
MYLLNIGLKTLPEASIVYVKNLIDKVGFRFGPAAFFLTNSVSDWYEMNPNLIDRPNIGLGFGKE